MGDITLQLLQCERLAGTRQGMLHLLRRTVTHSDSPTASHPYSPIAGEIGARPFWVVVEMQPWVMVPGGVLQLTTLDDAVRLIEHLRRALETRGTIGQAQGILMERYGLDPEAAFAFLTRLSSTLEMKIRDLSEQIVSGAQIET